MGLRFPGTDSFSPSGSSADERAGLFVLGISVPKGTGRGTALPKVDAEARSLEKDLLLPGEELLYHLPFRDHRDHGWKVL